MIYDARAIERKWQERRAADEPFYVLTMFPYPSGERLHLGHWFQYGLMDTWARLQKLLGKQVFQPMGFDAFGLPAENHAVRAGVHPAEHTRRNVAHMTRQYRRMGVGYAWRHLLNTSDPTYYRWTQCLFRTLYDRGLAYRKNAPLNWCPNCNTVLTNEQVVHGACERCDAPVLQRDLEQWFFRITAYAEELDRGLDELDWPAKTVAMQRHWIGRREGAEIRFPVLGTNSQLSVFTTRPDTVYGVTYLVLAPEHPSVDGITPLDRRQPVAAYRARAARRSELERVTDFSAKTGEFTGAFAVCTRLPEKLSRSGSRITS